jgi:hypothetical protein
MIKPTNIFREGGTYGSDGSTCRTGRGGRLSRHFRRLGMLPEAMEAAHIGRLHKDKDPAYSRGMGQTPDGGARHPTVRPPGGRPQIIAAEAAAAAGTVVVAATAVLDVAAADVPAAVHDGWTMQRWRTIQRVQKRYLSWPALSLVETQPRHMRCLCRHIYHT